MDLIGPLSRRLTLRYKSTAVTQTRTVARPAVVNVRPRRPRFYVLLLCLHCLYLLYEVKLWDTGRLLTNTQNQMSKCFITVLLLDFPNKTVFQQFHQLLICCTKFKTDQTSCEVAAIVRNMTSTA